MIWFPFTLITVSMPGNRVITQAIEFGRLAHVALAWSSHHLRAPTKHLTGRLQAAANQAKVVQGLIQTSPCQVDLRQEPHGGAATSAGERVRRGGGVGGPDRAGGRRPANEAPEFFIY